MGNRIVTIYRPDGNVTTEEMEKPPDMVYLQTKVGGYFEYVKLPPGNGKAKMAVNEDGRRLGLHINLKASKLAGQPICGNAVVW